MILFRKGTRGIENSCAVNADITQHIMSIQQTAKPLQQGYFAKMMPFAFRPQYSIDENRILQIACHQILEY
jgi:hypothetical protein